MRRNKTFLAVALLAGVLMLGVGYAAIQEGLNVTGNATSATSKENFKIAFDSNVTVDDSLVNKTNSPDADVQTTASGLNATIDVTGLTTANEKVVVKYTIKNTSPELGADLALGTITNSKEAEGFFKVTAELSANKLAAVNGTAELSVTVELLKTPIEEVSTQITVPVTATATVKS